MVVARSAAFTTGAPLGAVRPRACVAQKSSFIRYRAVPARLKAAQQQQQHNTIRCSSDDAASKTGGADKSGGTAAAADSRYWQGEWICVDCGFTYKPGRKVKFEDLPASWKCPQCNAPKRRFAKKAGTFIAETSGTSNLPILLFSAFGLLATIAFGIWASQNL